MEIIGYSERGAMNALFYGMSKDGDGGKNAMRQLIKLATGLNGDDFSDFTIYSEFSLSDFGDPDMMVIAEKNDKSKVVFFIEAKASCCDGYDLSTQQRHHEEYMKDGITHKNGHSSNLFFQLRLKNYFIQRLKENSLGEKQQTDAPNHLTQSRNRNRKIGDNVVVANIVNEISKCVDNDIDNVYYLAIIPEQASIDRVNLSKYGFAIHTINWEALCKDPTFRNYLEKTIKFNQELEETGKIKKDGKNQILNNPQELFE